MNSFITIISQLEKREISEKVGWGLESIKYPKSLDILETADIAELVNMVRKLSAPSNEFETLFIRSVIKKLREIGWFDTPGEN